MWLSMVLPPMSMFAGALSAAVLLPVVVFSSTPWMTTRIVPVERMRTAPMCTQVPPVSVVVDRTVSLDRSVVGALTS